MSKRIATAGMAASVFAAAASSNAMMRRLGSYTKKTLIEPVDQSPKQSPRHKCAACENIMFESAAKCFKCRQKETGK